MAADPAMVIRISADLAELRRNMKEGKDQIETTTAAMTKLATSFSGDRLIQQAHNVTAAVHSIGGAAKLTAAEQERVNSVVTRAIEKYQALGREAPAAMVRLAAETEKSTSVGDRFNSWIGKANTLLGVFGATLSIGALVSFGKQLLDMGDQIVKVADRTGLTTIEVQKLQYIAGQSGNSLDQMTGAINKLQVNLVRGNDGAVGAVKALGINLAELKAANPYEQMEQIATAIAKVPNPATQSALAVQLFGRAGAELLPTLIANFKGLGDAAPVMQDKTVRALEAAGDRLNTFGLQIKVWAAESYNWASQFFDLFITGVFKIISSMYSGAAAVLEFSAKIPGASAAMGALGLSADSLREKSQFWLDAAFAQVAQLHQVEEATRKAVAPMADLSDTNERAGKEAEKLADKLAQIQTPVLGLDKAVTALTVDVKKQYDEWAALRKSLAGVEQQSFAAAFGFRSIATELESLGTKVDVVAEVQEHLQNFTFQGPIQELTRFRDVMASTFKALPSLLMQAFTGGGNISGAFKALFTQFTDGLFGENGPLSGITAKLNSTLGNLLGKGLGSTIGGALSSAISGLLPGLGGLIAPLVKGIGKLFGFGESESEKTGKLRRQFIDAAGGIAELEEEAARAGVTLEALFNARKPKDFERAVRELQTALEFQDQAMQTLEETVRKYGFSIEQLGPAMRRQELEKQAQELFRDFTILHQAGVDNLAVIERMGPAVNEFVNQSLAMGAEIPAAMRPMLQHFIALGGLVDANGDAITDISQIPFAETMSEGFTRVVDEVRKLVEAIERGLNPAIRSIPDGSFEVNGHYNPPDMPAAPDAGFATGTHGQFVNFGAGTRVTLHGYERVMTQNERTPGQDHFDQLAKEMRGMREDMRGLSTSIFYAARDGAAQRRRNR